MGRRGARTRGARIRDAGTVDAPASHRCSPGESPEAALARAGSREAQAVNQQIVFQVVKACQSVLYAERQIDVARHE
jgi:hypothetical protein